MDDSNFNLTLKNPDYTRLIPQEKDFLHYSTDDLLYGLLIYSASIESDEKNHISYLYVKKSDIIGIKKRVAEWTQSTVRTVDNHLIKLIQKEYIAYDVDKKRYIIKDYLDRYQVLKNETLYFLLSTLRPNIVKIYAYLLNKYKWKQQTNEYYYFSINELLNLLGYKNVYNTLERKAMKEVIDALCMLGAIVVKRVYKIVNGFYAPYYALLEVRETKQSFRPTPYEKLDPQLQNTTAFRLEEINEPIIVINEDDQPVLLARDQDSLEIDDISKI